MSSSNPATAGIVGGHGLSFSSGIDTVVNGVPDLSVGDQFKSIKDAKAVIRAWAISRGVSYKSLKDEKHRWVVVCRDKTNQCPFRIRVSYSQRDDVAKITIFDHHTCPPETHVGWKPIQPTNGFTHVTDNSDPDFKKPRRAYRKRAATELSTMIEPLPAPMAFPTAAEAALKAQFVGRSLHEVPTPAAVIDVGVARRNCILMLEATTKLGLGFRAHVKTHKTTELTRLQVGEHADVNLVVSTLAEAENLVPFLSECLHDGRRINVLYGIPLPPSSVLRLAKIGKQLGSGSVSVLIDHHEQLHALKAFYGVAGFSARVFIKVDTGYHRAGVEPHSQELKAILRMFHKDLALRKSADLYGFYSHAGHSYSGTVETDAMNHLAQEILRTEEAANVASQKYFPKKRFVISVGATPTATSIQNILGLNSVSTSTTTSASSGVSTAYHAHAAAIAPSTSSTPVATESQMLRMAIDRVKMSCDVELHAGVYPVLDMQQLAIHARAPYSSKFEPLLTYDNVAFTVLAEVTSVYPDRPEPEALIAAGGLALGREPCSSYPGWGIVTNWGMLNNVSTSPGSTQQASLATMSASESGWIVGRLSQEHGILTKYRPANQPVPELSVGQKVRIVPNHACIASAGFGWYLVIDPGNHQADSDSDVIVDVWVKWRGW